jgi:hypothetical protein
MPMAVKALVVIIREINHDVGHAECPAAVLVHPGAGVEGWRRYIVDPSIGGAADDDVAPTFTRALLYPVDVFTVQG